jgi:hypothetical protein
MERGSLFDTRDPRIAAKLILKWRMKGRRTKFWNIQTKERSLPGTPLLSHGNIKFKGSNAKSHTVTLEALSRLTDDPEQLVRPRSGR